MNKRTLFDIANWSLPPQWCETDRSVVPGVRSVFFENIPWRGKPTRCFAFLGLPEGASERHPCPGVVLVHGGGGTAFHNWVRLWNQRGYAAIAMDTCGCVPDPAKDHFNNQWERHADAGPGDYNKFHDRSEAVPMKETWMYHAIATVIKSNSLLRELPEVDANAVGITGVSWGGTLTCVCAGLDPRFQWAAPVYGCGFRDPRRMVYDPAIFDPARHLRFAAMPFLYLNGTNDFSFHLNNWARSLRENRGDTRACLRVNMPHGHGEVSENPPEILDFAEAIRTGSELPPKFALPEVDSSSVATVRFHTRRKLARAELNFTRARGYWSDRKWNTIAAELTGKLARQTLPPQTQAFFFNLHGQDGLLYSSPVVERRAGGVFEPCSKRTKNGD